MATVFIRDFPDELHHRAKVQVAKERTTLKDLVTRLLREYLDEKEKGG